VHRNFRQAEKPPCRAPQVADGDHFVGVHHHGLPKAVLANRRGTGLGWSSPGSRRESPE
jgi:hypothetical protein